MSMFAIQHVEAQRTMMEREIARAEALGRHFSEARWQRHRRGTETARPVASTVIRLPRRTPDPTFPPAAA